MAKWTNYYKIIDTQPSKESIYTNQDMTDAGTYSNFSWYQKIVQGSFSRFARYREYDVMDKDVEVSRALDTIAEEMTGNNPKTNEPIEVRLLTQDEAKVKSYDVLTVKAALRKWNKIHKWDNKLFKIARLTVKYGDCFFRKRSYHSKWEFIHPKNVVAAIVDTNDINNILAWQVKAETNKTTASGLNLQMTVGKPQEDYNEIIPANEIVRFTLNDDMSDSAPFGESILAPVFKTHKQKELLEDAIIIYRVQRSPERRVFYIDVGKMPPQRVKTYLETIKNEIKQKKIPTMNGGQSEVDSVYNPHSMCLALDTKIPLLDGRTVTLSTMIDEYNNGKQNWVYSINPKDGNIVPGIVSWAGVTQQNTDTIKLTLDNGETIICTPEHKFPVQGRGFIEAKDLTPNDSLFPFNTKKEPINSNSIGDCSEYTKIYNPKTKGWSFVHRLVGNFMLGIEKHNTMVFDYKLKDLEKNTIHHIDLNSINNEPDNLSFMNFKDHCKYHLSLSKNQQAIFSTKLIQRFEQLANENINILFNDLLNKLNDDSVFMDIYKKDNIRQNGTNFKLKTDEFRQKMFLKFIKVVGYKNWKEYQNAQIVNEIQKLTNIEDFIGSSYAQDHINLIQFVLDLVKKTSIHNYAIINYLKENPIQWSLFVGLYKKVFVNSTLSKPESAIFERISKLYGYDSFKTLITEASNFNHRVIKIEPCEKQDVGTLTIDKDEIYHNYHTFALTNCFTKNSEDFFFACLSMKTKVYLLDGRTLTIDELRQEYEEGKENWTYSVDQQTGKLIAGKIDWAGYTRKNAEMVRVLLDNDISIDCTPDHKFVLRDGTEVEAQFLTPEMSLMPMHTNIIQDCGCSDKVIQQKIISVTWLDEREDTGCLHVIDENNNHNFALEAGVYVKNSRPDGRGSRVETLPGGANLGQLEDLDYFQRKVWRGLKVPASYMIEQSEGGSLWNDGKVGIAYIQELRFALFIMRLQGYLETELDFEFKLFLRNVGITIDENLYELSLPEPSNFGKYKQLELDGQIVSQYGSIDSIPYISKRFALKRYMKLTDQEIVLNERMLREERNLDVNGDAKDYPAIYGQVEDAMGGAGGMGGMGGMSGGMGAPMDMGADLGELPPEEGSVEGAVPPAPTEKI